MPAVRNLSNLQRQPQYFPSPCQNRAISSLVHLCVYSAALGHPCSSAYTCSLTTAETNANLWRNTVYYKWMPPFKCWDGTHFVLSQLSGSLVQPVISWAEIILSNWCFLWKREAFVLSCVKVQYFSVTSVEERELRQTKIHVGAHLLTILSHIKLIQNIINLLKLHSDWLKYKVVVWHLKCEDIWFYLIKTRLSFCSQWLLIPVFNSAPSPKEINRRIPPDRQLFLPQWVF